LPGSRISDEPQNSWNFTVPALSCSTRRSQGATIFLAKSPTTGMFVPNFTTVGSAAAGVTAPIAAAARA
jgi:hypothetical protein